MTTASRWFAASDDALGWLRQIATFHGGASYQVGPMPDKVYLLHPFIERVDCKRVQLREGDGWVDPPDRATAPLRPVRWDEYAKRRGLPSTVGSDQRVDGASALAAAAEDDDFVWTPAEGSIDDTAMQEALFEVLVHHTTREDQATCTALFYRFGVDPGTPLVMRGPLGAWDELFNRTDRVFSPQSIWPDSHEWVVDTDVDAWATAVSGTADLADALLAAPALEAIRLATPQD